jgi:hypothetical protein
MQTRLTSSLIGLSSAVTMPINVYQNGRKLENNRSNTYIRQIHPPRLRCHRVAGFHAPNLVGYIEHC